MPACEKCWADSHSSMGDQPAEYRRLIEERRDNPCTPEQQCGEMHLVLEWKDGRPPQCRCGKVKKEDLASTNP